MTSCAEGTATAFQLAGPPALSRSTVDRNEPVRDDEALLANLWADGRLLAVDPRGRTSMRVDDSGPGLDLRKTVSLGESVPDGAVFLGRQDGVGYWATRVEAEDDPDGWQDLRTAGGLLSDTDAGLFTTAVGLLSWHEHARFCASCGATTGPVRSGWARVCVGCEREEYPRTDPAVICLVHDDLGVNGQHVLLGRQPVWPPDRYSVLAGFVEVGESLESTVAREVHEEVGVRVRSVRYLASQPWPFPRSLMLGFAAVADHGAPLYPAPGEIEAARWVHRDQVRAAFAAGGDIPGLRLPPSSSIARRMLEAWAAAES